MKPIFWTNRLDKFSDEFFQQWRNFHISVKISVSIPHAPIVEIKFLDNLIIHFIY